MKYVLWALELPDKVGFPTINVSPYNVLRNSAIFLLPSQIMEPSDLGESTDLNRRQRKHTSIKLSTQASTEEETVTIQISVIETHELANLIRTTTTFCTRNESSVHRPNQMVFLLDCRSFLEFSNSHIITAVNICTSKIIKRRLERNQVNLVINVVIFHHFYR